METAGLVISIIALLLTIITYFKHDNKLKKQEALLNKYQLEKIDSEKVEEKRAIIEANVIRSDRGSMVLKIYNRGKSTGRNVNVMIPEIAGVHVINNPCPIDIRPQGGIDINMAATMEAPDKIKIDFEWQDSFKDYNKDSQYIQI
jgi:hypothetical protein